MENVWRSIATGFGILTVVVGFSAAAAPSYLTVAGTFGCLVVTFAGMLLGAKPEDRSLGRVVRDGHHVQSAAGILVAEQLEVISSGGGIDSGESRV